MAKLKVNSKTEFLYLEENFLEKLVEILQNYIGQKILFITDSVSQNKIRQSLKLFNCEVIFYLKENCCNTDMCNNTDILSQYLNKSNLKSHSEELSLIIAVGSDIEINIAKQISTEFKIPYIIVLNNENSSICYSGFYTHNLEIKQGMVPLGIIINLSGSNVLNWEQKIILEKAKVCTLKCCKFFDELFLGAPKFSLDLDEENNYFNINNLSFKNKKEAAEHYCDIALLEQYEPSYYTLFLLTQIYKTFTLKNTENQEFFLYKTLIKIYEIFTANFLLKYKCFKCYDSAFKKDKNEFFNSSYIKYVLINFNDLINKKLQEFYSEIKSLEEGLNNISFTNMYKDKLSMSSEGILKAIKIFAKIQKTPLYLNIIDFYNLF